MPDKENMTENEIKEFDKILNDYANNLQVNINKVLVQHLQEFEKKIIELGETINKDMKIDINDLVATNAKIASLMAFNTANYFSNLAPRDKLVNFYGNAIMEIKESIEYCLENVYKLSIEGKIKEDEMIMLEFKQTNQLNEDQAGEVENG